MRAINFTCSAIWQKLLSEQTGNELKLSGNNNNNNNKKKNKQYDNKEYDHNSDVYGDNEDVAVVIHHNRIIKNINGERESKYYDTF